MSKDGLILSAQYDCLTLDLFEYQSELLDSATCGKEKYYFFLITWVLVVQEIEPAGGLLKHLRLAYRYWFLGLSG